MGGKFEDGGKKDKVIPFTDGTLIEGSTLIRQIWKAIT